ncbi:hypothetical protein [Parasphingorhabdus pacifica]
MSAQETAVQVLAQAPGGEGADFGKSSPVGLLLLVLFGIAVALLVKSMTKHLKALPVKFDEQRAETAAPARAKRTRETGSEAGAASTDAASTDAGETDAGETDAGETDAGETDAGETSREGSPREGTSGS